MEKIIIESNLSRYEKVHNTFLFEPIEKQLYNYIQPFFEKVEYETSYKRSYFIINDSKYEIVVSSKGVRLEFRAHKLNFYMYCHPKVFLPFNTDVSKKIEKFFIAVVPRLEELFLKAQPLNEWCQQFFKKEEKEYNGGREAVENFLREELSTDVLTVSIADIYNWNFFTSPELRFFIIPKEELRSWDIFVLEHENYKIIPFEKTVIDNVVKNLFNDSGIEGMKQKVKAIEDIQEKIKNFNPQKCPQLVQLLEKGEEIFSIINEAKAIV